MNLPRPLNNNVLVEIVDPHSAVSRNSESESQKKGRVVTFNINHYHLTASSAIEFSQKMVDDMNGIFKNMVEKGFFVYWEEFANEGQGFTHEGKQYAFVAWWRLTGFEEPEEKE